MQQPAISNTVFEMNEQARKPISAGMGDEHHFFLGAPDQCALAAQYERVYDGPLRNIDLTNSPDEPLRKGDVRVFGSGFAEKLVHIGVQQVGPLD